MTLNDIIVFRNQQDTCGGSESNSVYATGINVPRAPRNLKLEKSTENSLTIKWSHPDANLPKDFITDYHIFVNLNDSFDPNHNARTFSPKHIQLSHTSRMTTILGLRPGSRYNVSVAAASKFGIGKAAMAFFYTEIGDPETPAAPNLIRHDEDNHDHGGEIHVQLKKMSRNRFGPITKYRVLVIDETDPAPFVKANAFDYVKAKARGIKYWIAAELNKDFFQFKDTREFVVGDNRTYGGYLNFGPLPEGRDYHVSFGLVSTSLDGSVTKVSYAKVSHDQHAMENIVVFEFHEHGEAHDHDHDHEHERGHKKTRLTYDIHKEDHGQGGDHLAIGLSVACVIFGLILAAVFLFYVYLRWTTYQGARSRGSRGDMQELTPTHHFETPTGSGFASSATTNTAFCYDNESVDAAATATMNNGGLPQLQVLRTKVWNIPRNFLELSHEVIGRGRFGSLVKGNVNKSGGMEAVNVQVVPGKILEDREMRSLAKDLEVVVRYGNHENLIQLIGLCEEKDTIFVVIEQAWPTLKQALLDSRALIHHPVYAEKNRRFSTIREDIVLSMMLGVAKAMDHLSRYGVSIVNDNCPLTA